MTKTNKQIAAVVAALIIVGGLSFFGGIKFADAKSVNRPFGQMGMNSSANRFSNVSRPGGKGFSGAIMGEVLSTDANGFAVKLMDGGSKIVLVASSTQVTKFQAGSKDDLVTGANVMVVGATNADGSVSAQSVQIRPAGATR